MPAERVSMRQIREVLRLRFASELPQRAIAKSLGLSQGAVSGYLSRARAAGVSWPLPADLDDVQLEALLFPPPPAIAADQRTMPDWAWVHRELRRPNVTLALLWEEYRGGAPDGFGYSWFCDLYRGWAGRLKPTMRQTHIAGEKLFVDFAGRTGEVVDGLTGEIIPVQIFVAVLGASNFTYAEAVWSQKLPDWIAAHVRTFACKSWLACALGHKACREGFSVLYKRASRLFTDLAQARGEGRLLGSVRHSGIIKIKPPAAMSNCKSHLNAKTKPRQGECRGFSDWRLVRGRDIANPTVSKHIVNCYATITIDDTASSEILRFRCEKGDRSSGHLN